MSQIYDEEGTSKRLEPTGVLKKIITLLAVAFSFYHLYTSYFGIPPALRHRAIHLAFASVLIFLLYPTAKGRLTKKFYFIDIFLALLSVVVAVYLYSQFEYLTQRMGLPNTYDVWFGFLTTVLVLEAARRVIGWPMPLLAIIFLAYGFLGRYFPGPLAHGGLGFEDLFSDLYTGLEGIYGVAIGVSSTYIVLFVIFGGFLSESGAADFFFRLAQALFGTVRGGPAKISVLSSSLFGTVSGSAVANVMVDGWLTIPLMKRVGFKPHVAGAIEAAASTGGQIVPPVMGAAAFIMAEVLGIPYIKIALAASIPAFLYYFALFMMIDLEAAKCGLSGLDRSELPRFKKVILSEGHLIIPFLILIYLLAVVLYTPIKAGFYSILSVLVVSWFRKSTRMNFTKIILAMKQGAIGALPVVIACACAGIIVGIFTYTGLGVKLSSILITLSGGNLLVLLILVGLSSLILGMGMPTTVVYIILATLAAPALVKLGIPPIAAHLFVFYYGILSHITPPVALSAYAAASLADASAMDTGYAAWRMGLAGFIVPFMFVYGPPLVMVGTVAQTLIACVTAVAGVIALAIALQGYLFRQFPFVLRLIPFASSLLMIKAGFKSDLLGIAMFVPFMLYQLKAARKEQACAVASNAEVTQVHSKTIEV